MVLDKLSFGNKTKQLCCGMCSTPPHPAYVYSVGFCSVRVESETGPNNYITETRCNGLERRKLPHDNPKELAANGFPNNHLNRSSETLTR